MSHIPMDTAAIPMNNVCRVLQTYHILHPPCDPSFVHILTLAPVFNSSDYISSGTDDDDMEVVNVVLIGNIKGVGLSTEETVPNILGRRN